ncbi:hypothetical protein SFUMM280S_09614 [Streptomyces fumanus]
MAQVIAIALIGCAIGAATAGRIADRIGRIRCMQIAAVLFTVSAIGSALPFALWDLAMWRVIGGFAIGMASVIGPAYIAEVSPPAYRGRLGSFQQAAIVIGIAVAQLVNWGLLNAADGDQRGEIMGLEAWQVMLGVMVIPAVLYGLLSFAIPESPRFLISVGKHDRARQILEEVEGHNVDLDARVTEIETAMHREEKSSFKACSAAASSSSRRLDRHRPVGVPAVRRHQRRVYYSSTLWQSVGVDPTDSFLYRFPRRITALPVWPGSPPSPRPNRLVGMVRLALRLGGPPLRWPPHAPAPQVCGRRRLFALFRWRGALWVFGCPTPAPPPRRAPRPRVDALGYARRARGSTRAPLHALAAPRGLEGGERRKSERGKPPPPGTGGWGPPRPARRPPAPAGSPAPREPGGGVVLPAVPPPAGGARGAPRPTDWVGILLRACGRARVGARTEVPWPRRRAATRHPASTQREARVPGAPREPPRRRGRAGGRGRRTARPARVGPAARAVPPGRLRAYRQQGL